MSQHPPASPRAQPASFAADRKRSREPSGSSASEPSSKRSQALTPPRRRPQTAAAAPLSRLHLYLHPSIPFFSLRSALLKSSLEGLGSEVSLPGQAAPSLITHVVVAPGQVVTQQDLLDLSSKPFVARHGTTTPPRVTHGSLLRSAATFSSASSYKQRTPSPGPVSFARTPPRLHRPDGAPATPGSSSGSAGRGSPAKSRHSPGAASVQPAEQQLRFDKPPKIVEAGWVDAMLQTGMRLPSGQFLATTQVFTAAPEQATSGVHASALAAGASTDTLSPRVAASTSGPAPGSSTPQQQGLPLFMQHPLDDTSCLPSKDAPLRRYHKWLGFWHPKLDGANRLPELMMWPRYNIDRSTALGNEPTVKLLMEMCKYEEALGSDEKTKAFNGRALTYAHAAAALRGCSFTVTRQLSAKDISKLLPYCGSAYISGVVHDLIHTGTCDLLERFRANKVGLHSNGTVRPGTEGAAVRREFCRIPGVGPASALTAWSAGCRNMHDLENWLTNLVQQMHGASRAGGHTRRQAAGNSRDHAADRSSSDGESDGGGRLDWEYEEDGPGRLKSVRGVREMLHGVRYREDLLAPVPVEDTDDMKQALLAALEEVSGVGGWELVSVGGGRRLKQSHDADFLATHKTARIDHHVRALYNLLVSRGQLVPKEEGFCRMQEGRRAGYIDRARMDATTQFWVGKHQQDRYDNLYGLWITAAGKRRRMDIVLVPPATWWFGLVGWTGSRQLMRFMRTHASDCKMSLNSHALMRPDPRGPSNPAAVLVPQEAPPLGRGGTEQGWPPGRGWESQAPRDVTSEADLFLLLGVPCREVADRNCPG